MINPDTIVVGVVTGTIAPVVVSFLQHKYIWRTQKKLEMKHAIFLEATRALALYARDAMDPEFQGENTGPTYKNLRRAVKMRPETVELIEKSLVMVRAFFSHATFERYDAAMRAKLSLDNIPNEDFYQKQSATIIAMAEELGISQGS